MLSLALTALAAGTSAAAVLVVRRRRRRPLELGGRVSRVTPLPAGLQHLAARMTDLSDAGLHLRAVQAAGKPRLGSLLGLR
jgi:hypothetical protein